MRRTVLLFAILLLAAGVLSGCARQVTITAPDAVRAVPVATPGPDDTTHVTNLVVTGSAGLGGTLDVAGGVALRDELAVAGGYGSSGCTFSAAGALQCDGSITADGSFISDIGVTAITTNTVATDDLRTGWFSASSESTTLTLPAAAAGLKYCLYNYDGATMYVDPATGDQVHVLTNAAGDRISNTTAGDSICLLAVDTTYWIATERTGTWSDAN